MNKKKQDIQIAFIHLLESVVDIIIFSALLMLITIFSYRNLLNDSISIIEIINMQPNNFSVTWILYMITIFLTLNIFDISIVKNNKKNLIYQIIFSVIFINLPLGFFTLYLKDHNFFLTSVNYVLLLSLLQIIILTVIKLVLLVEVNKFSNDIEYKEVIATDLRISKFRSILKRLIDITLSMTLIIILFIPMIVLSLIVKLTSKGPIIYKQKRYKKDLKTFNIYKFRSMRSDQTLEQEQTPATKNDPRYTKIGNFLRITHLDELPQLINILKGDMSFVGPRPLMCHIVNKAIIKNPHYEYRFNVKPGLTGIAQIYDKYEISEESRLKLDLLYIYSQSTLKDIQLIFLTIPKVFGNTPVLKENIEVKIKCPN